MTGTTRGAAVRYIPPKHDDLYNEMVGLEPYYYHEPYEVEIGMEDWHRFLYELSDWGIVEYWKYGKHREPDGHPWEFALFFSDGDTLAYKDITDFFDIVLLRQAEPISIIGRLVDDLKESLGLYVTPLRQTIPIGCVIEKMEHNIKELIDEEYIKWFGSQSELERSIKEINIYKGIYSNKDMVIGISPAGTIMIDYEYDDNTHGLYLEDWLGIVHATNKAVHRSNIENEEEVGRYSTGVGKLPAISDEEIIEIRRHTEAKIAEINVENEDEMVRKESYESSLKWWEKEYERRKRWPKIFYVMPPILYDEEFIKTVNNIRTKINLEAEEIEKRRINRLGTCNNMLKNEHEILTKEEIERLEIKLGEEYEKRFGIPVGDFERSITRVRLVTSSYDDKFDIIVTRRWIDDMPYTYVVYNNGSDNCFEYKAGEWLNFINVLPKECFKWARENKRSFINVSDEVTSEPEYMKECRRLIHDMNVKAMGIELDERAYMYKKTFGTPIGDFEQLVQKISVNIPYPPEKRIHIEIEKRQNATHVSIPGYPTMEFGIEMWFNFLNMLHRCRMNEWKGAREPGGWRIQITRLSECFTKNEYLDFGGRNVHPPNWEVFSKYVFDIDAEIRKGVATPSQ
jgi:hypothetical protein